MNFYDTNTFFERIKKPLQNEDIMISSITLDYCTELNVNVPKDFDENVNVLDYEDYMLHDLEKRFNNGDTKYATILIPTNEIKDLAVAYACDSYLYPDETVFISNDLSARTRANRVFGSDSIDSIEEW